MVWVCSPFFNHLLWMEPRRRNDGVHGNMNSLLLEREGNMLSVLRSPAWVHRDRDDFSTPSNSACALWSRLKNTRVSWCERDCNNITALEFCIFLNRKIIVVSSSEPEFGLNSIFSRPFSKSCDSQRIHFAIWVKVTNFIKAKKKKKGLKFKKEKEKKGEPFSLSQVT